MGALDYLSVTTHRNLMPQTTDNVFLGNPLMMLLIRRRVLTDGGATFAANIRITRNPAGSSYQGADLLPIQYDTANFIGAEWNWAQYGRLLGITGLDELRNSGARAVVNLIKNSLEAIEMELREDMGTDLYSDGTNNSSKAFVGLDAIVDDSTNVTTYAGISRSTYPNWKGKYYGNAGVGRAMTWTLLNTAYDGASKDNDRPQVGMLTHLLYTKLMGLMQGTIRTASQQLGNLGFQNLTYQNRPLIVDELIPTSPLHRLYFLNFKYMVFYTATGRNFAFIPFQMLANQDVAVAKILWAGALACTRPASEAVIRDIDTTL